MAKKSSIEKNNRRRKLSKKYSGRRARLKAIAHDKDKPMEERFSAVLKLAESPLVNPNVAEELARLQATLRATMDELKKTVGAATPSQSAASAAA